MNLSKLAPAGWQFDQQHQALVAEFLFADYYRTIAFVNAVASIAHQHDHHPELEVSYSSCRVRFTTHSAGGITEKDLVCAQQVNAWLVAAKP